VNRLKINFTQQELEVLKWMALGKSDLLMADIFAASLLEVQSHVSNIQKKLNVENRVDASLKAIRLGLV